MNCTNKYPNPANLSTRIFGPDYKSEIDEPRLTNQRDHILRLMIDGHWRTLREIASCLAYPEASVSAQLRHLRKLQFGGWTVNRRLRAGGLREYQVLEPQESHEVWE